MVALTRSVMMNAVLIAFVLFLHDESPARLTCA